MISPTRIWLLWLSALLWSRLSVTWWPLGWPHTTNVSDIRVILKPVAPDQDKSPRISQWPPHWGRGGNLSGGERLSYILKQYKFVLNVSCFKGYHGVLHADCWTSDWQQFCPSWLSERAKVNWIEYVFADHLSIQFILYLCIKLEMSHILNLVSIKLSLWYISYSIDKIVKKFPSCVWFIRYYEREKKLLSTLSKPYLLTYFKHFIQTLLVHPEFSVSSRLHNLGKQHPVTESFWFTLYIFRNQESRTVVECDFGEGITNRVLSEDEEDEREDVASV